MNKNPRRQIRFRDRVRFLFDNLMSKGTVSMVAILFAITFLVVVIAGILVVILDPALGKTFREGI